MLFTPRLYMYKGQEGITLECDARNQIEVFSMYADLMYCAALNHWTLTHSADEEFPYKRIDFHVFSVDNRDIFCKAMLFSIQTLSGKSMKELIAEAGNAQKTQGNGQEEGEPKDVKKKSLFGSITTRLRRIWSAIVD